MYIVSLLGAVKLTDRLLYALAEFFPSFFYRIWTGLASIVDIISLMFNRLIGLEGEGYSGGESFVMKLIQSENVKRIFQNLVAVAIVLMIFFTILQIIRENYLKKDGGNPYMVVFRMFKGITLFMFITAACLVGLQLSGVMLKVLNEATGGGSYPLSGQVFLSMSHNGNRARIGIDDDANDVVKQRFEAIFGSKANVNQWSEPDLIYYYSTEPVQYKYFNLDSYNPSSAGLLPLASYDEMKAVLSFDYDKTEEVAQRIDNYFVRADSSSPIYLYSMGVTGGGGSEYSPYTGNLTFHGNMDYSYISAVRQLYQIDQFSFIIGYGAMFMAAGIYLSFIFGLIQRMMNIAVIYVMSPITLAFFPIDNGQAFNGQFVKPFYKQAISSYAIIISLNLYFALAPTFSEELNLFKDYKNDPAIRYFSVTGFISSTLIQLALLSTVPKIRSLITGALGADQLDEKKLGDVLKSGWKNVTGAGVPQAAWKKANKLAEDKWGGGLISTAKALSGLPRYAEYTNRLKAVRDAKKELRAAKKNKNLTAEQKAEELAKLQKAKDAFGKLGKEKDAADADVKAKEDELKAAHEAEEKAKKLAEEKKTKGKRGKKLTADEIAKRKKDAEEATRKREAAEKALEDSKKAQAEITNKYINEEASILKKDKILNDNAQAIKDAEENLATAKANRNEITAQGKKAIEQAQSDLDYAKAHGSEDDIRKAENNLKQAEKNATKRPMLPILAAIFDKDAGAFYKTGVGKFMDSLSFHQQFKRQAELEKQISARGESRAYARNRTMKIFSESAQLLEQERLMNEDVEKIRTWDANKDNLAKGAEAYRKHASKLIEQSQDIKPLLDALRKDLKGNALTDFNTKLTDILVNSTSVPLEKLVAERLGVGGTLTDSVKSQLDVALSAKAKIMADKDNWTLDQESFKDLKGIKKFDGSEYGSLVEINSEFKRTGDLVAANGSVEAYENKMANERRKIEEKLAKNARIANLDISELRDIVSEIAKINGKGTEFETVMRAFADGQKTVTFNGQPVEGYTKDIKWISDYQAAKYKEVETLIYDRLGGQKRIEQIGIRDYAEKVGDRTSAFEAQRFAMETIKGMQGVMDGLSVEMRRLFSTDFFKQCIEEGNFSKLGVECLKASRGEASELDPEFVASVAKKSDFALFGNMLTQQMGQAKGEMRGDGIDKALNMVAATFRLKFVDQIVPSLEARGSLVDQEQIALMNQLSDVTTTVQGIFNSSNKEMQSIMKEAMNDLKAKKYDSESFDATSKKLREIIESKDPKYTIQQKDEARSLIQMFSSVPTKWTKINELQTEGDTIKERAAYLKSLDGLLRGVLKNVKNPTL